MIRALAVIALLGGLASPTEAQVHVGLSAFAGGFVPVGELFESVRIGGQTGPIVINVGQEPGAVIGGRLTLWLSRLGIDAEAVYAFSNADLPQALTDAGADDDAALFMGSLNLMYVLVQAPFSPLSIHISGGAGVIRRTGGFFDNFESTTDVAGVFGLGVRYGFSRLAYLRFDLRDYLSSFAPTTRTDFQFDSKVQNDLIGTLALELVFTPIQ